MSKLSWEEGDLQLIQHPGQPGKLILFYGRSSREFWGRSLTPEDYAHVLKLKFGADLLVESGDLVSPADYFISFLPDSSVALLSEPLVKHPPIAEAARDLLLSRFPRGGAPGTLELASSLDLTAKEFSKQQETLARELENWSRLRWDAVENVELREETKESGSSLPNRGGSRKCCEPSFSTRKHS